jgi:DNA-binding NarL/FixJ family response regulator
MLTSSVIKRSGNLRIYYKNCPDFDEYSDKTEEWERHHFEPLTEQEIRILRFSKQRLTNKQIAEKLDISYYTLRHANMQICKKFHVETMLQAVIYATDHLLLFDHSMVSKKNKKKKCKKHRDKLTPEILQDIETRLNNGQSKNFIAKEIDVSEGTIRYAIKKGKVPYNS